MENRADELTEPAAGALFRTDCKNFTHRFHQLVLLSLNRPGEAGTATRYAVCPMHYAIFITAGAKVLYPDQVS